jgi:hypothetical protein
VKKEEELIMEKVKENKSPDKKSKSALIMDQSCEKMTSGKIQNCLEFCSDKDNCLSLNDILSSFNAPLSEEQAWSLIYQSVQLYRNFIRIEFIDKHTKKDATQKSSHRIKVPKSTKNLNVHKDGSVHISDNGEQSEWKIDMKACDPEIIAARTAVEPLLRQILSIASY